MLLIIDYYTCLSNMASKRYTSDNLQTDSHELIVKLNAKIGKGITLCNLGKDEMKQVFIQLRLLLGLPEDTKLGQVLETLIVRKLANFNITGKGVDKKVFLQHDDVSEHGSQNDSERDDRIRQLCQEIAYLKEFPISLKAFGFKIQPQLDELRELCNLQEAKTGELIQYLHEKSLVNFHVEGEKHQKMVILDSDQRPQEQCMSSLSNASADSSVNVKTYPATVVSVDMRNASGMMRVKVGMLQIMVPFYFKDLPYNICHIGVKIDDVFRVPLQVGKF